jgi:endonuclease/exonuclease/phosphatase family metal-dependent hydrolase
VRLRLVTYNVQSFRGGFGRVLAVLEAEQPDVVLLQECGSKVALQRLASALRRELASTHRPFSRVHNAVLFPPAWRVSGIDLHSFSRAGRSLRRGVIALHLRRTGMKLSLVSAHFGLSSTERIRHARELTDLLLDVNHPLVIGVDLNEDPDGPAARWIGERLFDGFLQAGGRGGETFPSKAPTARIDFLFVSVGVRVLQSWVPGDREVAAASDHRPVFADVEIAEP